jgi:biopolymer transport protein TolR
MATAVLMEHTFMSISKREEGKKVNSNINVTPMVDVMLVLLIIFMVITPMLGDKVTVELPKVSAAVIMDAANKEDAITVAVTRDGSTFLGGDKVALPDLSTRIQDLESRKTNPGDDKARANFGKVEDTIDALRTAGVNQLNLMTDKTALEQPAQ